MQETGQAIENTSKEKWAYLYIHVNLLHNLLAVAQEDESLFDEKLLDIKKLINMIVTDFNEIEVINKLKDAPIKTLDDIKTIMPFIQNLYLDLDQVIYANVCE